ncbi:MAG TPA: HPr family phosphocarrier protein [Symbiobacteriaceae bacterium]|nr:HPr family phosphocarrier protein [Symbiobacteriaceae bacterium]
MQLLEVTVNSAVGLHARPAANLVQTARNFAAEIFLEKGGKKVSAKSLLSVLSLGVKAGERVAIAADGADEAEALAAISKLAANDFGEAKGV